MLNEIQRLALRNVEVKGSALPLGLTVKVEATNGNTTRYALEAVVAVLGNYHYPSVGQVIEDKFWRATILDACNRLPNESESPNAEAQARRDKDS